METYTPNQFFNQFLKISENLTLAELRMLYILIIQPEVFNFSQQAFAEKIKTNRRTINIGLKKLRECGYIIDLEDIDEINIDDNNKAISKINIGLAKRFIVSQVIDFYKISNQEQIVNEDLYNIIIGSKHLHKKLRYDKEFITETIKNSFKGYKFHFLLSKSDYASEMEYDVINYLNKEIEKERNAKKYSLDKEKIMEYLSGHYNVSEKDAIGIIRSNFHRILIKTFRITIQKNLNKSISKIKKKIDY